VPHCSLCTTLVGPRIGISSVLSVAKSSWAVNPLFLSASLYGVALPHTANSPMQVSS